MLTTTPYSCIVFVQSDSLLRRPVTGLYNDRCNAPSLAPENVKGSMDGVGVLVSLQLLDAQITHPSRCSSNFRSPPTPF